MVNLLLSWSTGGGSGRITNRLLKISPEQGAMLAPDQLGLTFDNVLQTGIGGWWHFLRLAGAGVRPAAASRWRNVFRGQST